ncbi:MAG: SDR family oxidoreductase [Enhygromyxa sp.]
MSNILITGTSSGFGFSTAQTLSEAGHHVVATMRELEGKNADKAAALREAATGPGQLHVVELDVTDDLSVEQGVARARELLGSIDVLINNAGRGGGSYVEAYTTAEYRDLFEVNLFGVHRMCRAVLPHMRARKQGLIVNLSSGFGRVVFPFTGPYNASKFALEAYSEGLAMELAPTGVEVVIMQPGPFRTPFFKNRVPPGDAERVASYGELATVPEQTFGPLIAMIEERGPDPKLVVDKLVELISMPAGERPLRTSIDPMFGHAAEAINEVCARAQAELAASMQAPD